MPVVIPPPAPLAPVTVSNWCGEYYNRRDLSGAPVLVREDAAVNFDWGAGVPAAGMFADNFSIRGDALAQLAWERPDSYPDGLEGRVLLR